MRAGNAQHLDQAVSVLRGCLQVFGSSGMKKNFRHFWHVGMRLPTRAKHSWRACSVHYTVECAHTLEWAALSSAVFSFLQLYDDGEKAVKRKKMKTRSKKDGAFFEGEEGEIWGNLIFLFSLVMVPNIWPECLAGVSSNVEQGDGCCFSTRVTRATLGGCTRLDNSTLHYIFSYSTHLISYYTTR